MLLKPLVTVVLAASLISLAGCSQESGDGLKKAEPIVLSESNMAAGLAFLEKNGQLEGVKTTESGLQYKVLKEGEANGEHPGPTSKVTVHYEGRHLSGEVFDSSFKRNEPISFGLNRVIPGWTEGLQLMTKGAKYQLYIPSNLAYGNRGAGSAIDSDETLIFDVELIEID